MHSCLLEASNVQREGDKQLLSLDIHPTLVCIVHFYGCHPECAVRLEISYLCVIRYA